MPTIDIAHAFYDKSIRIEKIIWIAANLDSPCEDFREFLTEEEDGSMISELLSVPLNIVQEYEDDLASEEFMTQIARLGRRGFLVLAATPVPFEFTESGGIMTYGWGHYTTKWFYFDVLDASILETLVAWKTEFHNEQRQRLEKKTKKEKKGGKS